MKKAKIDDTLPTDPIVVPSDMTGEQHTTQWIQPVGREFAALLKADEVAMKTTHHSPSEGHEYPRGELHETPWIPVYDDEDGNQRLVIDPPRRTILPHTFYEGRHGARDSNLYPEPILSRLASPGISQCLKILKTLSPPVPDSKKYTADENYNGLIFGYDEMPLEGGDVPLLHVEPVVDSAMDDVD
jgi:hypothetical protein